jgi:hypothetical protein
MEEHQEINSSQYNPGQDPIWGIELLEQNSRL